MDDDSSVPRLVRAMAGLARPLVAAVLATVLGACGFGSPVSSTSRSSPQQGQQRAQALMSAMQTCLTRAGYQFVGPPPGEVPAGMRFQSSGGGDDQMRNDPAYKAAYDRCATSTGFNKQFSNRGPRQPLAGDIQKANKQILKLYTCLRQKGWTLADPTRDADGGLTPPQPPSDVQGDQARMSQFANDMNSCSKSAGMNGTVTTGGGGGNPGAGSGGSLSVSGGGR